MITLSDIKRLFGKKRRDDKEPAPEFKFTNPKVNRPISVNGTPSNGMALSGMTGVSGFSGFSGVSGSSGMHSAGGVFNITDCPDYESKDEEKNVKPEKVVPMIKCEACNGTGSGEEKIGESVFPVPCEQCGGSGEIPDPSQIVEEEVPPQDTEKDDINEDNCEDEEESNIASQPGIHRSLVNLAGQLEAQGLIREADMIDNILANVVKNKGTTGKKSSS